LSHLGWASSWLFCSDQHAWNHGIHCGLSEASVENEKGVFFGARNQLFSQKNIGGQAAWTSACHIMQE
jgi:hypothetical protein